LKLRVVNPVPGIPFYEPVATGGDSGSPVFFVLNRWPIFEFSVNSALIQGPFVSNPVCFLLGLDPHQHCALQARDG
jgi:hypothetical protein